jgi:protein gp37
MAIKSSIEWTNSTWNPVTGCNKTSPGCKNCYAERLANRLQAMGQKNYSNGFEVTIHNHSVELPLRWKKPQRIFVNSMSDLFHESVPEEFIHKIADVMRKAHWHNFQILTKRSSRLVAVSNNITWSENVWIGVSVENNEYIQRIDHIRSINAKVKFLSLEPLLGPIEVLDLDGIDWVIVGGESGPGARPMKEEWATSIRDKCNVKGVPFFFKQWGGVRKKNAGRILQGKTWNQIPANAN